MSTSILLFTTNKLKVTEISHYLGQLAPSLKLIPTHFSIEEMQSIQEKDVIEHKANQARALAKGQPFLVEDTGFYTSTFPRFPGPLAKPVWEMIGIEGFKQLFGKKTEPRVEMYAQLAYVDEQGTAHFFRGCASYKIYWQDFQGKMNSAYSGSLYKYLEGAAPGSRLVEYFLTPSYEHLFFRMKACQEFAKWYGAQMSNGTEKLEEFHESST